MATQSENPYAFYNPWQWYNTDNQYPYTPSTYGDYNSYSQPNYYNYGQYSPYATPTQPPLPPKTAQKKKPLPNWAIALIVIIVLLLIGGAIAAMVLLIPTSSTTTTEAELTYAPISFALDDSSVPWTSDLTLTAAGISTFAASSDFTAAETILCNKVTAAVSNTVVITSCNIGRILPSGNGIRADPLTVYVTLDGREADEVRAILIALLQIMASTDADVTFDPNSVKLNYCDKSSMRSANTCAQICLTKLDDTNQKCSCNGGYNANSANHRKCDNVDECTATANICETGNTCKDDDGSYYCQCQSGKINSTPRKCRDVNACEINDDCEQTCTATSTTAYTCGCNSGYTLNSNLKTCLDVNECMGTDAACATNGVCTNYPGTFTCECNTDFYLDTDGKTCVSGTLTVAVSPTSKTVLFGVTESNPTEFTCTITLTGTTLIDKANTDFNGWWVKPGGEKMAVPLAGTGSTRTVESLTLATVSHSNHGQYYCIVKAGSRDWSAMVQLYAPGCKPDQFKCSSADVCVDEDKKCDGTSDCVDNSDENEAACGCTTDQFSCDGMCKSNTLKCDGKNDCKDFTDERKCDTGCASPKRPCSSDYCLPAESFCDFKQDCPSFTDEGSACISNINGIGGPTSCGVKNTFCDETRCISDNLLCDHTKNCNDGTDEKDCSDLSKCFACDGGCIHIDQACDGEVQCGDGADEVLKCTAIPPLSSYLSENEPAELTVDQESSSCRMPYKIITTNGAAKCIHPDLYCDGTEHYTDGADEPASCTSCDMDTHFICDTGRCLPNKKKCNGFRECQDNTDETGCTCDHSRGVFSCESGSKVGIPCLPISKYCDGTVDCIKGEDEEKFCQSTCPIGFMSCRNPISVILTKQSCIHENKKCDGRLDCPGGFDEYDCPKGNVGRPSDSILCSDKIGWYIPSEKCDGIEDCPDGSDESDATCTCPRGKFKCDGKCKSEKYYCDGNNDCKDKADEPAMCLLACLSGVMCQGNCMESYLVCDGKIDCPNKKDEENCPAPGKACTAANNAFECTKSKLCIPIEKQCDGVAHCKDGSDETSCAKGSVADCHTATQFYCDGRCKSNTLKCNGEKNCQDGSDETSSCSCGATAASVTCLRLSYRQKMSSVAARGGAFKTACGNGQCILLDQWCDGEVHCMDGTDETSCTQGCRSGTFQCTNSKYLSCVPDAVKCDGLDDCDDGSDEMNCATCPITTAVQKSVWGYTVPFFTCAVSKKCILPDQVCDGRNDCGGTDDSDETMTTCCGGSNSGKFICKDGKGCVELSKVCDGKWHCSDGSDEKSCVTTPTSVPCKSDEFTCANKNCVPNDVRCDRNNDCLDWSDEKICTCQTGFMKCASTGVCIRDMEKCDGNDDCGDNSDEASCATATCASGEFQCANKRCIPDAMKCDKNNDCGDWSDELSSLCPCQANEFTCTLPSICLDNKHWCDRWKHCPDGSDESSTCSNSCKSGQIQCDGRCVDATLKCDGIQHCSALEDEATCTCKWGMFKCKNNARCLDDSKFCDGVYDCIDKSDEPSGCSACPPGMYTCAGGCRTLLDICRLPASVCTDARSIVTCSTQPSPVVNPTRGKCGVPVIRPNIGTGISSYIAGGNAAVPHSHPWIANMRKREHGMWKTNCAGAIINKDWIVTAAHCLIDEKTGKWRYDKTDMKFMVGEHDMSVQDGCKQTCEISEDPIIHPDAIKHGKMMNDIALVKCSKPIQFSNVDDCIQPICLTTTAFPKDTRCITAGWGTSQGSYQSILQNTLAIIHDRSCLRNAPTGKYLICTSATLGWGDGGGPLMCDVNKNVYLAGIASYGFNGNSDYWTDPTKYTTWITSVSGATPV